MGNVGYLVAAYIIVYAVIFGYVALLFRRKRRLQREIELLREKD
jgi:CcmD family protein